MEHNKKQRIQFALCVCVSEGENEGVDSRCDPLASFFFKIQDFASSATCYC